jgi:fructokinase
MSESPWPPITRSRTIVGLGELLWDLLPSGPRLGGAPFNVLAHLRRLGYRAEMVTAVGDDDLGRRAIAEVDRLGVGMAFSRVDDPAPTGVVDVELDPAGVPRYIIRTPAAYENASLSEEGLRTIGSLEPAAIVYGTLAQRFPPVRGATSRVLAGNPDSLRVYDVNLRVGTWSAELVHQLLGSAELLKLNEDEVRRLGPALGLPAGSDTEFGRAVLDRYPVEFVCVTRGSNGAALLSRDASMSVPGLPVTVVDTVGAGDAFTAGLIDGILRGSSLADTLRRANALGALVASRSGAIPHWEPGELSALVGTHFTTTR